MSNIETLQLLYDPEHSSLLFTDGSSSTRTGKCGWSVVGYIECRDCQDGIMTNPSRTTGSAFGVFCRTCEGHGKIVIKKCGFGDGTNQKAELFALVFALRTIPNSSDAMIISDSKYSLDSICSHKDKYRRNGYVTYEGKPISYLELVQYGHSLHDSKDRVKFKHVRGHVGVTGNEEADKLCKLARYVAEGRQDIAKIKEFVVGDLT